MLLFWFRYFETFCMCLKIAGNALSPLVTWCSLAKSGEGLQFHLRQGKLRYAIVSASLFHKLIASAAASLRWVTAHTLRKR